MVLNYADLKEMDSSYYNIVVLHLWAMVFVGCLYQRRVYVAYALLSCFVHEFEFSSVIKFCFTESNSCLPNREAEELAEVEAKLVGPFFFFLIHFFKKIIILEIFRIYPRFKFDAS